MKPSGCDKCVMRPSKNSYGLAPLVCMESGSFPADRYPYLKKKKTKRQSSCPTATAINPRHSPSGLGRLSGSSAL
eukprot:CAMPEP_0178780122 /NCGR_PEP_ID=MMETSP0745-20121128/1887_1 /TAXON_ID=913974 /ORGANISM="Nitzschia punctata, Strain CCMP561" /LENGTH=74 /DNA_ID=CAMNT_0020437353 /DNA_START=552 /DNA_END=776 /DNA_ORIENTATION=-